MTIPRGHEGNVVLHSIQLFVENGDTADAVERRAQELIAQRLRTMGPTAIHLGEVHVSSPDFTV